MRVKVNPCALFGGTQKTGKSHAGAIFGGCMGNRVRHRLFFARRGHFVDS